MSHPWLPTDCKTHHHQRLLSKFHSFDLAVMQRSLPSALVHPVSRIALPLKSSPCIRPVKVAARKSRPFERKPREAKEVTEEEVLQTVDEVLTAEYLASLSKETWEDDPPNHRSGIEEIDVPILYAEELFEQSKHWKPHS